MKYQGSFVCKCDVNGEVNIIGYERIVHDQSRVAELAREIIGVATDYGIPNLAHSLAVLCRCLRLGKEG